MTKHTTCGFVWKWGLLEGVQQVNKEQAQYDITRWANWILAKADAFSTGEMGIYWDNPTRVNLL